MNRHGNNAAYEPSQSGWTEYEESRRRWKFRGRVIEDCARRYRLWATVEND